MDSRTRRINGFQKFVVGHDRKKLSLLEKFLVSWLFFGLYQAVDHCIKNKRARISKRDVSHGLAILKEDWMELLRRERLGLNCMKWPICGYTKVVDIVLIYLITRE